MFKHKDKTDRFSGVNHTNFESDTNRKDLRKSSSRSSLVQRIFWRIAFLLALMVFIAAFAALGFIIYTYWDAQANYDKLANAVVSEQELPRQDAEINNKELAGITVNWKELKATNPDIVAWIYVPDTVVNYPIVQTNNNSTYLTRTFEGGQGYATMFGTITQYGTVFVNSYNKPNFEDDNDVIFGHHMYNGTMFGFIDEFMNNEKFNSHRTMYLLTPEKNYKLETFAVIHCIDSEPIAQTNFSDKQDKIKYIRNKLARNAVTPDPEVSVDEINKIFTFVTCDNRTDSGRLALFATPVQVVTNDSSPVDLDDLSKE